MAKLTLHVPEDLVAAAKSEAASREVSLSKLVSDFFRSLASEPKGPEFSENVKLAPRTQRLVGCLTETEGSDYEEYLEEKYS